MKEILILWTCLISSFCFSQEEMETDRPDQTECASLVQPKQFQLETGFIYTRDHSSKPLQDLSAFNYGTSLFRIGIVEGAEFRIEAAEYEKTHLQIDGGEAIEEGFIPLVIGTKIKICDGEGLIPRIAFLAHLGLPFGDEKFFIKNEVIPSFRFSVAHELNSRLSLGYNLGME